MGRVCVGGVKKYGGGRKPQTPYLTTMFIFNLRKKNKLNYMMRTILLAALCLAPCFLFSQTVDAVALRRVDSLIRVSRALTGKGEFDKAFIVNAAEKLALEKFGPESPAYGNCCFNRGKVNFINRNYPEAQKWFLEVKAIREKTLGKEHLDYAKSLVILGGLFQNMDAYEQAELFLLNAKAIYEKRLGKEHADYTATLNSLASFYKYMGDYKKAELLYLEAIAIHEKTSGKEDLDYSKDLHNLAILYEEMGLFEKAEPLYTERSQIDQSSIRTIAREFPEQELNYFMGLFYHKQSESLSFAQRSGSKKVVPTCFDNILFYKGFLLHSSVQTKQLALSDPDAAENLTQLKTYKNRLAYLYAQPITDRDSIAVEELEAQVFNLEEEIVRTVAGMGQDIQPVKWQEVQAALRPSEAAVEFVSYFFYHKEQTDSIMYAALVLLPGAEQPQFIPLFEEKQLAALLQTEGKPQPSFYNVLYAADKKGSLLYELIWKPIAATLPESTTVYCSPSDLLHRMNLGAIPTPDGKTLGDKYRLTMLGSTRQLIAPVESASNENATAQLYGGIQYNTTPLVATNTETRPNEMAAQRGPNWGEENDPALRGDNWKHLPWTDVEVTTAAEIMKGKDIAPTLKKGAEATEESFKMAGTNGTSPRILHIATHGFFFPDPVRAADPLIGNPSSQTNDEKTFQVSENPMIRSGLVLAGGNHAWKTGKPLRPGLEDGILTAYEISQMNLANTELVVLSACETGLGDLVGNEGVYGLQRAFKIAGTKYLVMSLWQVPDFQTQVFMTAFYKHWLERRMAVPEAFRATQAELRGKYSGEAFKWAGFVLVE
jgi:CHAT domain-containing protein/tetratricopeptide (TPR) repeat protein